MLIARRKKNTVEVLMPIIFLLILCLVFFVYFYHVRKPLPSGVDATNYIPAAQWIEKTGQVPDTYQPIQLGMHAYTSPFPSLDLALLRVFTNLNLTFPLFSSFQLFTVLFLCFTTYLVGSIYNRFVGLLSCLFIIISQGYAFLFTGSTIGNLLALSLVNIIFYLLVYLYRSSKKTSAIILILISTAVLFFTHRQLTFPLFLITFAFYLFCASIKFKKVIKDYFQKFLIYTKTHKLISIVFYSFFLFFLLLLGYKLYTYSNSIITEWIKAYVVEGYRYSPFGPKIKPTDWLRYLNPFYFAFGFAGILIVLKKIKKENNFYYAFPIIWVIASLLLSLINYFGLSFETPRWLYQGYVFLSFLSGVALFEVLKILKTLNKTTASLAIMLIIAVFLIYGTLQNKHYSDTSNFVTKDDIAGYKFLYQQTQYGDTILSNLNKLSVGYDRLLLNMERKINHQAEEFQDNGVDLQKYLIENKIRYIIFREDGEKNIDYFKQKEYLEKMYTNKNILIYEYRVI